MLPAEPDVAGGAQGPSREFTIAGISRPPQPWTLRLFPHGLRLSPRNGGPAIHLLRSELATHVQFLDFGVTRRTVAVRKPIKRNFKLDPEAWAALREWTGREARLGIALRHRLGYGIPLGVVLLLTSLPVPGNRGVDGVPGNPLSAALGVALITGAILARRRPHPTLLLLDSTLYAMIAGSILWRVAHGGSLLWLVVVALQVLMVWSGISLFRDLSTSAPDPSPGGDARANAPP